jgi:hypothetical protein
MTTLAFLTPLSGPANHVPRSPLRLMWFLAALCLAALLFHLRKLRMDPARRLGYACAGMLLFACLAVGMAGCGGNGGGGGGITPHNDSITAVYSGDATYAGSTSAAVTISVH